MSDPEMQIGQALLLGIVEGLTEYLPVSSTGHLLLTQRAMGIGTESAGRAAADSYAIVIQIGAIFAVVSLYTRHIGQIVLGMFGRSREGAKLLGNLVCAFFPAAVVGLLFMDLIKAELFHLWAVSAAWILGGVALLVWGRKKPSLQRGKSLEELSLREAMLVGVLQCAAVWPGTSRSLVTILGGRLAGLSLAASVTFSFLLGMVTLSASTAYDLLKNGSQLLEAYGLSNLLLGVAAGWVSALIAVKGMVAYLNRHGLGLFGGYRIAIGGLTILLLLTDRISP